MPVSSKNHSYLRGGGGGGVDDGLPDLTAGQSVRQLIQWLDLELDSGEFGQGQHRLFLLTPTG